LGSVPTDLHPDHKTLKQQKREEKEMTSTFRKDIDYYKKMIGKLEEHAMEVSHGVGNKEKMDKKERMLKE
jgi:hypothetical protein